jgi:hypothetical protein
MFRPLIRLLVNFAHIWEIEVLTPTGGQKGTENPLWSVATFGVSKKSSTQRRTTLASVKREMQQPRLAASVRNDPKYQAKIQAKKNTPTPKSQGLARVGVK